MERPGPAREPDPSGPLSRCHVSLLEGAPLSLWTPPGVETKVHVATDRLAPAWSADTPNPAISIELCLAPGRLIVVGRSSGRHEVPYLDPAYRATTIVPE